MVDVNGGQDFRLEVVDDEVTVINVTTDESVKIVFGSGGGGGLSSPLTADLDFNTHQANNVGGINGVPSSNLIFTEASSDLLNSSSMFLATGDGAGGGNMSAAVSHGSDFAGFGFNADATGQVAAFFADTTTFTLQNGQIICSPLPTADPGITGALWNDLGTVKISP